MQDSGIGKKVASGLIWTSAESILSRVVGFIVTIILARILEPEEYGTIALVTILMSFFDVMVVSGMGSALIQKKDANENDFSSVTWLSLMMATVLYVMLYFSSKHISYFFNNPSLELIIKVVGLRLFFSAINSVQHAYVSKNMLFKLFFIATLTSSLVSGIIGIIMAMLGYGVWALVAQYMINVLVNTLIIRLMIPLRIKLVFAFNRIRELFSFGWKLLCSSLLDTLYDEIVGLSIGKKYSAADLSFYDKGKQIPCNVSTVVNTSISKTVFPAMAKIQEDRSNVKKMAQNNIKVTSMLMFPILIMLIIIAQPLIVILFTEKWIEASFYMEVLAVFYLLKPFSTVNLNVTKSLGHSEILLKNNLIRKFVGIIVILLMVNFSKSPKLVVMGVLLTGIFDVVVNMLPNKKLINYGIFTQLYDAFPYISSSFIIGCVIYPVNMLVHNSLLCILIQTFCYLLLYNTFLIITKDELYYRIVTSILHYKKVEENG